MNDSAPTSTRCSITDSLKGFAIACVVLGHSVLRTVPDPPSNPVYLALLAFEMPLFMFLSGYVLPGRVRSPRGRWTAERAVRLMVPFLVWQSIFFLSRRIGSPVSASIGDTVLGMLASVGRALAFPATGLWYLPALAICSALVAALYPLRERVWAFVVLGWAALLAAEWALAATGVRGDFGVAKAATHWPYFAAGFAFAQLGRDVRLPGTRGLSWLLVYPLLAGPAYAAILQLGGLLTQGLRIVLGLLGIAFSVVALNLAEKPARLLHLDVLGKLTLGIYCSHWLFLRVDFGDGVLGVAARFAFTLACSTALSWAITRWAPARAVLLGEWPRKRAAVVA